MAFGVLLAFSLRTLVIDITWECKTMKLWSNGYKLNLSSFLQAGPNVLLFKHAPMWLSIRYLRLLGSLYYIFNLSERRQIEKNIRDVFRNGSEADEIIKKAFQGIFFHYSEKLLMAYRNFDMLKREIGSSIQYSGLEHIKRALRKGGVLLVTGHFGGVEFLPLAFHLVDYPVSMVVAFQTEQLRKNLQARAMSHDVELIDGHGPDVMKEIIDALKRGRIVITECDEIEAWRTKGNRTINAFGGQIKLDRTLDVLCRRSGAEVLSSFMVRTDNGYRLIIDVIEEEEFGEEPVSVRILKKFEENVMMFPEQWYEWKKLHKMRPEIA